MTYGRLHKSELCTVHGHSQVQEGGAAVALPLKDRSRKIVPVPSRLLNKKPLLGDDVYKSDMSGIRPRDGW